MCLCVPGTDEASAGTRVVDFCEPHVCAKNRTQVLARATRALKS